MSSNKNMLSLENALKLAVFVVGLSAHYYTVKSDIRELYTEKKYEVEHLQYQINEVKDCCKDKQTKTIAYNQAEAIITEPTKYKTIIK